MVAQDGGLLGIDGGGTRGRLVLAGRDGRVTAGAMSGPLNLNNAGADEVGANLRRAVAELPCPIGTAWIHAGVAGVKTAGDGERYADLVARALGMPRDQVRVVNDIGPLLLGGLAGGPGIALILGTGSHASGRDSDGRTLTCGGWGRLMDDAGSGHAIGHRALREAVRMWDGRREPTALAGRVAAFLEIDEPGAAMHRVYNEGLDFAAINELGRQVVTWAAEGEPAARAIVDDAVSDGLELVTTLARRLGLSAPRLVVTGGVADNPFVRRLLAAGLERRLPGATLHDPDLPPVAGAVIGAAHDAGIVPDDAFLATLRKDIRTLATMS